MNRASWLLLVFFLTAASLGAQETPTIALDQLVRGQKGYGLSVFAGKEVERFEVEVLGVLRGSSPGFDSLIARLSGKGLEQSGVVAGMSGSPVYFDGKLAGAVAYSYNFGREPIAGITPIAAMRAIPTGPTIQARRVRAGSGLSLADLVGRRFDRDLLEVALKDLKLGFAGAASGSPSLAWTAGGWSQESIRSLAGALGTLRPISSAGASGNASGPERDLKSGDLHPGDAVALLLVSGDLTLAAHGTVTDRVGDSIVAFGHPAFGFGPVDFPMASSEVVTVFPSLADSFKMSNTGPIIGSFVFDAESGVRGQIGKKARMIPLRIDLRGPTTKTYNMAIADMPLMRPTLLAISVLNAITAHSHSEGRQSFDLKARFSLRDFPALEVEQSFDGYQTAVDAAIHVLQMALFLDLSGQAEPQLEGVHVELQSTNEVRGLRLLDVLPARRQVAPGERVELRVKLVDFSGQEQIRRLEVEIPPEAPNGRFYLLVGDGTSLDASRFELEKRELDTFSANLEVLRGLNSRRLLQVLSLMPASGLIQEGSVFPALPGSMRQLLGHHESKPLPWRLIESAEMLLEGPLEGGVRVDLEVRRPKS